MTIKELEEKTGMARANIRFYEGEGLLAPKRLDNGYRDYSEEDARTLEKIKLLRQLQLDIDTIRKVQQGTLTLEQALFVQQTRLEGDKLLIERAAQVCRELGGSGVEYAVLNPKPWLAQLEAPAVQPVLPEPPADPPAAGLALGPGETRACWHPWMRFFARTLDMALYDTLINLVWLVVFRNWSFLRVQTANLFTAALSGMALLYLTLAAEPLWLHFWGWTPGKWVFGLKLRDKDGEKLPLDWAFDRSWQLVREGYGWYIPIYRLRRLWKGREEALGGWDGDWNGEHACRYTKVERRFSGWVFVAARVVLAAVLAAAMWWVTLTPCGGPLTVAEFARNYNHHCRWLSELEYYDGLPTLDREGRWEERPSDGGGVVVVGGSASVTSDGVTHVIEHTVEGTTVWDDPVYTLEDGHVTAVTLHMESGNSIVSSGVREQLALAALAGSVDRLGLPRDETRQAMSMLMPWENMELDCGGVHVVQQVEFEGYDPLISTMSLWSEGGDGPQHCEKTVTISLIEP